jgi:hypothetical protein
MAKIATHAGKDKRPVLLRLKAQNESAALIADNDYSSVIAIIKIIIST